MKLFQRITYYGIGLLVGSIFVYFVWGKKGASFDYLPNARVLKDLSNDVRKFSPKALDQMALLGVDTTVISAILTNGDIDFKNSSPRGKPCKTYLVDGKSAKKLITLTLKKCDSISIISSIALTEK